MLHALAFEVGTVLVAPPLELCTDNGAMIAWAGAERLALGLTDTLDVAPRARWPLDEVAAAQGARGAQRGVEAQLTHDASQRIAVLGGGAWGTALALTCARAGRDVTLWEHDAGNAEQPREQAREPVPARRAARRQHQASTRELAEAARADAILLVVPAQAVRAVVDGAGACHRARHAGDRLRQGHRARHAQIHDRDHRRMRAEGAAGDPVGAELRRRRGARPADRGDARRAPTTRSRDALAQALGSATFRPYHSTDVRGVEIGGAAKNVLAIAAGIVAGRGLGASAAAALTTRGFAELMRFGKAFGARAETHDRPVRPRRPGPHLLDAAVAQFLARRRARQRRDAGDAAHGKLAEGAFTAPVLLEMARDKNVEMPISAAVAARAGGRDERR